MLDIPGDIPSLVNNKNNNNKKKLIIKKKKKNNNVHVRTSRDTHMPAFLKMFLIMKLDRTQAAHRGGHWDGQRPQRQRTGERGEGTGDWWTDDTWPRAQ